MGNHNEGQVEEEENTTLEAQAQKDEAALEVSSERKARGALSCLLSRPPQVSPPLSFFFLTQTPNNNFALLLGLSRSRSRVCELAGWDVGTVFVLGGLCSLLRKHLHQPRRCLCVE